jgi:uncharacterized OB-fold protein
MTERTVAEMAGKIKNCPNCGKLYAEIGRKMCPDCYDKELEKEGDVIAYVREHKGAKIPEIVKETGANETMIKRLIREGRFEQVGIKMTYPCEKCGEPIITGKLCQNCQEKIRNDLQATQSKAVAAKQMAKAAPKPQSKGKGMYSLKNR